MNETTAKRIWIPQAIASVMLLWALYPENPYGYYILLRWICCAVFVYLTIQAFTQEKESWGWVLGVTAAVYNPILPLHLTRELWTIVNVVTMIICVCSLFALSKSK